MQNNELITEEHLIDILQDLSRDIDRIMESAKDFKDLNKEVKNILGIKE